VIKGILSNTGRNAYSVQNQASAFVKMTGYIAAGGTLINEDVRLDLDLGAPNEDNEVALGAPLLVAQGQTRRFLAIGKASVNEIPNLAPLLTAFESGQVKAYLAVAATGFGNADFTPLYSPEIYFRDFGQGIKLEPKPSPR
jgi:hypothetical protein